ncbi:mitochondrial 54S ribosomal protein YmL41 [Umbelopsis sp. WA50703]
MSTPLRQGLNKVYLPNIIFKMVRSPNLQPNQVAFRVPPKCNKFDIHSYLTNIYDVNVQEVRTMNYATRIKRRKDGRVTGREAAYKKAIVTIDEPFNWPAEPDLDTLGGPDRELAHKAASRKLKGWRFRAQPEEKAQEKELHQEKLAKLQAEQEKK